MHVPLTIRLMSDQPTVPSKTHLNLVIVGTDDDQMVIRSKITKAIKSMKDGVDIIFFAVKLGRYTFAEHLAFQYLCGAYLVKALSKIPMLYLLTVNQT